MNYLKGEYIPTAKNELVKDHYKNMGFKASENYWLLDVNTHITKTNFITQK
jgi:predicted enzyme involved in methoxymalonyl-ACP biosynthesis